MFWLKKKIERQTITYIKEKILFAKKNNKKIGIFLSETKQPNINIDDWFVVRNRKSFMIILENIYSLDFPLDNILFSLDCDSLTNDPDTDDVSIIQNMLNYLYKNSFLLPPNKNITYVLSPKLFNDADMKFYKNLVTNIKYNNKVIIKRKEC